MPQQWLATLKQARPRLAEALEDLCVDHIAKEVSQPAPYIIRVIHQNKPDEKVLNLFWECMRRRKEEYESRHQGKSN